MKESYIVSAIIVAAGKGSRMNLSMNKQYIEISGIPVLARTLQAFETADQIKEIVVVVNEKDLEYCQQSIIQHYGFKKVKALVPGGAERQHSVYNGLSQLSTDSKVVLIHDGARPFVNSRIIEEAIETAVNHKAACAAVPVKDTIKLADEELMIKDTPNRSLLWSVQTPQSFLYPVIMEAHHKAEAEGFLGTDDSVLVERMGIRVKLFQGSYENIKITTPEDLLFGEIIISRLNLNV